VKKSGLVTMSCQQWRRWRSQNTPTTTCARDLERSSPIRALIWWTSKCCLPGHPWENVFMCCDSGGKQLAVTHGIAVHFTLSEVCLCHSLQQPPSAYHAHAPAVNPSPRLFLHTCILEEQKNVLVVVLAHSWHV